MDPHRTSWEGLDGEGGEQAKEAAGADPTDGQVDRVGGHTRRRRDGGPQDRRQGQDQRRPGGRGRRVGRLAGTRRGRRRRPSAGHQTDPRAVATDDRGQRAAPLRRSRPRAGRTSPSEPSRRSRPTRSHCWARAWPSTFCWPSSRPSSPASPSTGWSPPPDRPRPDQPADQHAVAGDGQARRDPARAGHQQRRGALGLATVLGILTALWSASSGMKALITGVNLACGETEGPSSSSSAGSPS